MSALSGRRAYEAPEGPGGLPISTATPPPVTTPLPLCCAEEEKRWRRNRRGRGEGHSPAGWRPTPWVTPQRPNQPAQTDFADSNDRQK